MKIEESFAEVITCGSRVKKASKMGNYFLPKL
jgi:hypothetical protein